MDDTVELNNLEVIKVDTSLRMVLIGSRLQQCRNSSSDVELMVLIRIKRTLARSCQNTGMLQLLK